MRLENVKAGDIISVAKNAGSPFFAQVRDVHRGQVRFEPLCTGVGWRSCSSREVVSHWRRSGRPRPRVEDQSS